MSGVESNAGAWLARSGAASMVDGRFQAVGGRVGIVTGLVAVATARIVIELMPRVSSTAGADPRLAELAMIAVVALALAAVVVVPMALARTTSRDRGWVACGLVAALIMIARVLSHEVAIRATLPDAGGVRSIVDVRGVLVEPPTPIPTDAFDARSPGWRASIRVTGADHRAIVGRIVPVSLATNDARLVPGAEIAVRGRMAAIPPPVNPGERDRRRMTRDRVPARLAVPSSALVEVIEPGTGLLDRNPLLQWRRAWRDAARELDAAIAGPGGRSDGLMTAVLAGDRRRLAASIREEAEDAGLAPMLAISGWHLALAGTIAASIFGRHRPLGRLVTLLFVFLFMLAVVPGPSVRRAATMAVLSGILVLRGRRPRGLPIVAIGSAAIAWFDPALIESIGFVLSVVATLALVVGAGPARNRWFGPADRIGRHRRSLLREPLATAASASIVAWTVSAAIVLSFFGRLSWVAVPAMIIVTPAFVALMTTGMIAVTSIALFGESPGSLVAAVRIASILLVQLIDGLAAVAPITRTLLPSGVALPAIGAAACLLIAFARERWTIRWSWRAVAAVVFIIPVLLLRGREEVVPADEVRVDAIAVGDGTAILIRGSDGAVLVDAGSSTIQQAGRRVVIPTLGALGVRDLEAIVVTHANLDHFGEVASVVRAMRVGRVVVSSALLFEARSSSESVIGDWLHDLHARGVVIQEVGRGDMVRCGDLMLRVLHPVPGEPCRSVNDASIVATVHLVGDEAARARMLVCGDIQDEAMARILGREPFLSAAIMELPHHGSWRPIAVSLLDRVDPSAIVQSTGPDRWWMDRWRDACGARRRGITARDGLVSFSVDAVGRIHAPRSRRSEEPESGLVSSVLRATVGSRPDHHHRPVDPRPLGKGAVEDPGHALEQRGAG